MKNKQLWGCGGMAERQVEDWTLSVTLQSKQKFVNNPFGSACGVYGHLWLRFNICNVGQEQADLVKTVLDDIIFVLHLIEGKEPSQIFFSLAFPWFQGIDFSIQGIKTYCSIN